MLQNIKRPNVSELLADRDRVTEAVRQAGREARLLHKQLGVPIVVWKNGQIVEVPPEEIVVDLFPPKQDALTKGK